jgi:hypothetical protein
MGCIEANVASLFSDLLARPAFYDFPRFRCGDFAVESAPSACEFPAVGSFLQGASWSEWSSTARMIKKRSFLNHSSGRYILGAVVGTSPERWHLECHASGALLR